MDFTTSNNDVPDFLIKTTVGCSLVAMVFLLPFVVSHFLQQRFVLALSVSFVIATCAVNLWYGFRGSYSLLVNTYFVFPASTLAFTYAIFELGAPGTYPSFLLILAYYFVLPERRAMLFNCLAAALIIPSAWIVLDSFSAIRFSACLLGVSMFAYISTHQMNKLHEQLKAQAVTDELTGLFNRSLLNSSMDQAIAQLERTRIPMALVAFDVDRFKSINDSLGHPAGDSVLRSLGELLIKRSRRTDMVFRSGGEEFLVLIHNADEQQAAIFAESLREAVEHAPLLPTQKVTISLGVSSLKKGMDSLAWTKDVDEKLYRAKESGRNCVIV